VPFHADGERADHRDIAQAISPRHLGECASPTAISDLAS